MKDSKQIIEGVVRTLEQIEVKGRNNLDMLLGCILALESVVKEEAKDDG